jgi:hypothetical protein
MQQWPECVTVTPTIRKLLQISLELMVYHIVTGRFNTSHSCAGGLKSIYSLYRFEALQEILQRTCPANLDGARDSSPQYFKLTLPKRCAVNQHLTLERLLQPSL